jgi:hypothetical protein
MDCSRKIASRIWWTYVEHASRLFEMIIWSSLENYIEIIKSGDLVVGICQKRKINLNWITICLWQWNTCRHLADRFWSNKQHVTFIHQFDFTFEFPRTKLYRSLFLFLQYNRGSGREVLIFTILLLISTIFFSFSSRNRSVKNMHTTMTLRISSQDQAAAGSSPVK